jgi:hypothetical protein
MSSAAIDLDMACRLTRSLGQSEVDVRRLTYKSDHFHKVIDFDELATIEPPEGYEITVDRDITIRINTFRGISPRAVHYYCDILFHGPSLKQGNYYVSGYIKGVDVGRIFRPQTMPVNRFVTEEDLKDNNSDWEGYFVGSLTHRWYSIEEAIERAQEIIKLRFKNYGEVIIDNRAE